MTDRQPQSQLPPQSPQASEDVIGSAAPPRRLPRRVVAGISAVLALAVAAGGGIWVVAKVGDADRTAPTRAWPASMPDGARPADTKHLVPGGVGAKLLPVDDGYRPDGYLPGPDIGSLGNDNVLDAGRTAEHAKDAVRGLKAGERDRFAKALKKLKFTGGARRSYSGADNLFVVEIHLAQVEKDGAERALARFRTDVGPVLKGLRKGPSADCFLLPDAGDPDLDAMLCTRSRHGVLVTAYAYGAPGLDTKEISRMFTEQTGRLATSGESA
ncbi:hypothetical protein [Streptomyces niveus]|uniref:Secreted protein n=1 Tax=Streptomyces niveus TaxID=193462 RepID=A0A1U9QUS6_STRNV|nr:hypothetical protein [Streptomyces niveus]AQU67927.1 hypothetical protein BBN63_18565 [Streptomyces niveus]